MLAVDIPIALEIRKEEGNFSNQKKWGLNHKKEKQVYEKLEPVLKGENCFKNLVLNYQMKPSP